MSSYQIERNVPSRKLPPIPFKELNVGDRIIVHLDNPRQLSTIRQRVCRENQKGSERYSCFQIEMDKVYSIYRDR